MGRDLLPGWSPTALVVIGLVLCVLYVRHARVTENPILDLRLLRIETFRAGVVGGSLFRIGVGAVPFLLPLMFQLAYGMSAFESGLITFVAAAGAIFMKLRRRAPHPPLRLPPAAAGERPARQRLDLRHGAALVGDALSDRHRRSSSSAASCARCSSRR